MKNKKLPAKLFLLTLFTDQHGGRNLAERIRQKTEDSTITIENEQIQFTVSIGVFGTIPSTCDLNAGLKYADKALYKAKEQGKNRVVLYEEA